ncbi:MAG: DUF58 domain-containing protein [Phycisphaerales bacterium]|nr:DUF58 domain-containing protein [Phycisphaerales bacterium]
MLSAELMTKVRQLQILTARTVNEVFSGEYSSAFRGRGMEFDEVREYQPGDDIRTIDWNVTARSGVPHVKRYVEERELTIMLAVDLSSSGHFGSVERIKNALAAELCAVLAFAATRNNDKVGLLIFTDRIELFIPPKKGTRHVLRIIREVLGFEMDPGRRRGTDITGALEHLSHVLRRHAVIFLISDFLVDDIGRERSGLETALRLTNRRHDLVAIRVEDPREQELPRVGMIELEDAESGRRRILDTSSRRVRREYAARAIRLRDEYTRLMRRCGCDHVLVRTGEPYLHTLIQLFRRREHRR